MDSFDQAFGEAQRLFRERYDAEIHVDDGFKKRALDDAAVRRSLVDVVEALESLPVKVTRENLALRHVFLGEDPPESNWRGWYSWGLDAIHVGRRAFELMPRYTPDRPNAQGIWGFGGLYTHPVEDWADTWRILNMPGKTNRRELMVDKVSGQEYQRFRLMRRILKAAGLEAE